MFTMLLQNFLPKIGFHISYLLEILRNMLIIMNLICINYNNIINKPFSGKFFFRSNTLYMCLDIHAKFRGDRPRDLKGGSNNNDKILHITVKWIPIMFNYCSCIGCFFFLVERVQWLGHQVSQEHRGHLGGPTVCQAAPRPPLWAAPTPPRPILLHLLIAKGSSKIHVHLS